MGIVKIDSQALYATLACDFLIVVQGKDISQKWEVFLFTVDN